MKRRLLGVGTVVPPPLLLLLLLLLCGALPRAAATRQYCFDPSLVAFYPLDDAPYDTVAHDSALARPPQGGPPAAPLHLLLSGNASFADDALGRHLRLGRPSGLALSATAALKVTQRLRASGQFSVELWVVSEGAEGAAQGTPARIFQLAGGLSCPELQSLVIGQSASAAPGESPPQLLDYRLTTTATPTCADTWHQVPALPAGRLVHLVVTFDGRYKRVYTNGTLAAMNSAPGELAGWDLAATLAMGNAPEGGRAWTGGIYKSAVWDRALDACEVQQLLDLGLSRFPGDPCVYTATSLLAKRAKPETATSTAPPVLNGTVDLGSCPLSNRSSGGGGGGGGDGGGGGGGSPSNGTTGGGGSNTTQPQPQPQPHLYCWDEDLVAYYRLNEAAGAIVHDSAPIGDPLDLVINQPGRVDWIASHGGGAAGLRFTGRDTLAESAGPATKILDAIGSSQAFTVEVWLKTFVSSLGHSDGMPGRVVSLGGGPSCPADNGFFVGMSDARVDFRLRTHDGPDDCGADGRTYPLVDVGEMAHVVVTWSRASGYKRIYVNGVESYTVPVRGAAGPWDPSFRLRLGNELGLGRDWEGELRRVAVWRRRLFSCEVLHLFHQGFRDGATCPPGPGPVPDCASTGGGPGRPHCFQSSLVAFYPMTEGSGAVVADHSGGGTLGEPLDMMVNDPSGVAWVSPNGLRFTRGNVVLESFAPAAALRDTLRRTNQFSVELWLDADDSAVRDGQPAAVLELGRGAAGLAATANLTATDGSNVTGGGGGDWCPDGSDLLVGHAPGGELDVLLRAVPGSPCNESTVRSPWVLHPATAPLHVVVTWDGSWLSTYTNGVMTSLEPRVGNLSEAWLNGSDSATFLRLGNSLGMDRDWRGTVFQAAVFNASLAPCEVRALYGLGRDSRAECPDDMPPCAVTLPDFCYGSDLLLLYTFDEADGTAVRDQAGQGLALDLVLAGNTSAVEWRSPNGLRFTGPGVAATSGLVGSRKLLDEVAATRRMSVSVWFEAAPAGGGPIMHLGGAGACPASFLSQSGATVTFGLNTTEQPVCHGSPSNLTGNGTLVVANLLPNDGLPHHVVVVWAGCSVAVYLDGALVTQAPAGQELAWDPEAPLWIGNSPDLARPWLGTLYHLSVYRDGLSAEQVAQLHALGWRPGASCACNGASILDDGAFLVRTPGANRGGEFSSAFLPSQVNIYNADVPRKFVEFNLSSSPCASPGRAGDVDCFGFAAVSAEVWSREIFQYGDVIWTSKAQARSGAVSSVFTFHGTSTADGPVYSIIMSFAGLQRRRIVCNIKVWDAARGTYDNFEYVPVHFDWSTGEHEYRIRWRPKYVEWYADGVRLRRVDEDLFGVPPGQLGHIPYLGGRVMAHSWAVDAGLFVAGFRDFTGPYDPTDRSPHYFWLYCPRVAAVNDACCLETGTCQSPVGPAADGTLIVIQPETVGGAQNKTAAEGVGRRKKNRKFGATLSAERVPAEALGAAGTTSPVWGLLLHSGKQKQRRVGAVALDSQVPVSTCPGGAPVSPCLPTTQCLPPAPPPRMVPEESGFVGLVDNSTGATVRYVQVTFEVSNQYTDVVLRFVDGAAECSTASFPTLWSAYLSGANPCVTTYQALIPYDRPSMERCGFVYEDIEELDLNVIRYVAAVLITTHEPGTVAVDDQVSTVQQTAVTVVVQEPKDTRVLGVADRSLSSAGVQSGTQYLSFARLTEQIFDPATQTAHVRMVTAAVWPYFLTPAGAGTDDQFSVGLYEDTPPGSCEPTDQAYCVQEWVLPFAPLGGQCDLNAAFHADFGVSCFGPPAYLGDCDATFNTTQLRVDYLTASDTFCPQVVATGNVQAAIGAFSDSTYSVPETFFLMTQRAYFSTYVQGDSGVTVESTTLERITVSGAFTHVLYDQAAATAEGAASDLKVFDVVPNRPAVSRFSFILTPSNTDELTGAAVRVLTVSADLDVRFAVRTLKTSPSSPDGGGVRYHSQKLSVIFGGSGRAPAVSSVDLTGALRRVDERAFVRRPSHPLRLQAASGGNGSSATVGSSSYVGAGALPSVSIVAEGGSGGMSQGSTSVFGIPRQSMVAGLTVFAVVVVVLTVGAGIRRSLKRSRRKEEREARRAALLTEARERRAAETNREVGDLSVTSVDRLEMRKALQVVPEESETSDSRDSVWQ